MAQEMPEPRPTALVVLIPEAEPLAGPFRLRYDPSAAEGMPAHITVLYPFMPESSVDSEISQALGKIVGRFPSFRCSLRGIRRWPNVLWLEPHPVGPFRKLTQACVAAFPAYPPYSGEVEDPTPHLTVAQIGDTAELEAIEARFRQAASGRLPLASTVTRVSLMTFSAEGWMAWRQFSLGR